MDCDTLSKGLFVVGTGTDIGKTYVTGLLLKYIRDNGYNATYFKAALSGAMRDENNNLIPGDAVEVLTMADLEENTDFLVPYIYETAVSPHLASKIEGNPVELGKVRSAYDEVSKKYDYIVMEGSGGIVCPIRYEGKDNKNNIMLEDIIKLLDLNVILIGVEGAALGHLLWAIVLQHKGNGHSVLDTDHLAVLSAGHPVGHGVDDAHGLSVQQRRYGLDDLGS